jgi:putative ABC transport system permease protein
MALFEFDKFNELTSTLKKNKLRTILTGFSVAWGIFILIVLLASGKGLSNAMLSQWGSSDNSIILWSGQTALPYKGYKPGRSINLRTNDVDVVKNNPVTQTVSASNWFDSKVVAVGKKYATVQLMGILPNYRLIRKYNIKEGRDLNPIDMREDRKVMIITSKTKEVLFGDKNPIGVNVQVANFSFKIVGVYDYANDNGRAQIEACLPFTTGRKMFNQGNEVHQIRATFDATTVEASKLYVDNIRTKFARKYGFDPKDESAIGIFNIYENYIRNMKIFSAIDGFIWIIGVFTLIAGIVGISNIMIISVKERTKELGVRKAIGATPISIIRMVMAESIFITSVAGYVGLVLGVGLIELLSRVIPANPFFLNPTVRVSVAIYAVVILVVAGAIAGFFPARNAAKIKPVDALRADG